MSSELAHILLSIIVGISILLMLVRPFNTAEVYWVGAALCCWWFCAWFR